MAKIIKLPRCNPAENEAIQYRPGAVSYTHLTLPTT